MLLVLIFFFMQFEHKHPAVLPTDPATWQSCCREHDCMEAPISVSNIDSVSVSVQIAQFSAFRTERKKILDSTNGRNYFCRIDVSKPPTNDNIRCIFVAKPNQV